LVKFLLVLGLVAALACAQESAPGDARGPVLYGDGAGRIWKWDGEKTYLSPEGQNLVLGGVGEKQLWGWSVAGDLARFFTMALSSKNQGDKTKRPQAAPLVFDRGLFPLPDRADRVGDRILLVYGALSGQPRYEVWKGAEKISSRAWDDGRVVYASALGPLDGWVIGGRDGAGRPWLEVSGASIDPPEGWRGRLTVAVWTADDEKSPFVPRAAGWGAPPSASPQPLFWGPDGWTQPTPDPEVPAGGGIFPLLGVAEKGGILTLAGWQADAGTGTLRPWFWDGKEGKVPGGEADGQPQAFGSGKGGTFLVVRHPGAPWFTKEDGKESLPLEGLGPDDRVVAVEAMGTKSGTK